MAEEIGRQFVLVDTEGVCAGYLSEVAALVIGWNIKKKGWQVLCLIHELVLTEKKVFDEHIKETTYIYKYITGIPKKYLVNPKIAKPLEEILREIKKIKKSFPNAKWVARDPEMEKALLGIQDIYEICDFLIPPHNVNLLFRKNYPADVEKWANIRYSCDYHDRIEIDKKKHNTEEPAHAHCAVSDVFRMLGWLCRFKLKN